MADHRRALRLLALLVLFFSPTLAGAGEGLVLRATALLERPANSARVVAELATGERVELIERDRGWRQVRRTTGDRSSGWVRAYKVREVAPGAAVEGPSEEGGGFLSALSRGAASLFGGGASPGPTGGATATIGVRGLSAEDLRAAAPAPRELGKLDAFAVGPQEAARFARDGRLRPSTMAYLPQGAAPTSAPGRTGSPGAE